MIRPMNTLPLQFLLMTFAGRVNRNQQDVIEYLQEENRVLRQELGGGRLRFTDAQRSLQPGGHKSNQRGPFHG